MAFLGKNMYLLGKKTTPTTQRTAELMLVGATFFWGWTFPVIKEAVAVMPVFSFLALRFALAGLLMTCITRRLPHRSNFRFGAILGLILFLSFATQTWGLVFTSSSNSAFITGLNIVWVFALQRGAWQRMWLPVILAVGGLWLMTSPEASFNIGDLLTLGCSIFVAWHLLLLARRHESESSGDLAALQFWLIAILSAILALLTGERLLPDIWSGELIFALLLTAGGATVFAFWAQTHYQRFTTPLRVGLIFICEPLFAAAFALGFYDERLPATGWLGGALVFAAMTLSIWRQEKGGNP